MKIKILLVSTSTLAFMSLPIRAAEQDSADVNRSPATQTYSDRAGVTNRFMDRLGRAEKANEVIGTEVKNYQNEKLGKIDELAIDLESGRIVEVILSVGGVLGVGDTLVAVPPGLLHYDIAQKVVHLDAGKPKLKAAPTFEMRKWAENSAPDQISQVYRYYEQEPYFSSASDRDAARNKESKHENQGKSSDLTVRAKELAQSGASLGYVARATKVMGLPVKNLQDEKLGKVENLVVDLPAGRVVAVILSSGGFLGLGDELSITPPQALHFNNERDGIILDATKDSLTANPHFKSTQWPDLSQPNYTEGVYRSYGVEPYFGATAKDVTAYSTSADNTKRNVRDRASGELTPLDQGNNAGDLATAASIRKEILAQKDLSLNAKNVKIIATDGRVTLRGPVNSEAEKARVEEIARRLANSGNVDDQLEVASNNN